ncbi:phage tail terminator-like protein [Providencia sp.]|uniref:phage tail terminator-like protein n=1 Tax=Providencia sp. TaxID=589 RepID=UPI003F9C4D72
MKQSEINQSIRVLVAQIAKQEGLKVAWPNMAFDEINSPYLQLHIMPAATDNIGLALDMPILKGVIQINIVGKAGSGDEQLSLMADNIKAQLENGLALTETLYLNSEPNQLPPLTGDTSYTIPIRTSYRCDSVR